MMHPFTDNDFAKNKEILIAALGHPLEQTPCKVITLSSLDGSTTITARNGTFVSCALLEFLSDGRSVFMIDYAEHEVAQKFFAPLWNETGHSTIDFLRKPGGRVEVDIRQDDGLAKEAVEWLSNNPDEISHYTGGEIMGTIELLDRGVYRIAEPDENADRGWRVNQWLKQAILLSFKLNKNEIISGGPGEASFWYDKVPSKFSYWDTPDFEKAGFRAVPPCAVRFGAYIGRNVVLMPSLVNIGGYVDDGTMVDTWATVGSCAQIGKNVHLSGGVGIGGVLEPLQANPTIIEDGAFIGARSEVVEGVIVRRRAVLSMGVFIGKNTPIVDRTNGGNILYGEVPENAVVMMGVHPKNGLTCPQIVKYRDEKTDAATAINEILRG